ncbi:methyltransferase [Selenomonas sp. oral taxon 126]|uniref:class I SAM-dependent methyltransferase n=1 Tax=Selenomonas sp. oral taxon 126 TaxID=712528 RepID=UPI0008077804|nr:class I SAM-dependent methyltransferase [Selenomonas sp. oral taxon 126]ANR69621.1 methyltransferase [Selenomonas sp. oral taxon 126]
MANTDWRETDRVTAEGNPRRPEGEAGRAMLARMNESHARLVDWGLSHIDLHAGDTVLDIGCGGGNTLARMAERVTEGHLVGIDYAETSVEASRAFNAPLIEAGRMEILHGSVEHLPFADEHFDAVVTVESFYFWPNPEECLKEVARVIKKGGTFLLLAEIYERDDLPESICEKIAGYALTNPTPEEFERLFRAAGFAVVETHFKEGEYWIAVRGVR